MKNVILIITVCLIFSINGQTFATTYQVGPGKTYADFTSLPALSAGDVVEIYYTTYNKYKAWTNSSSSIAPITIKGIRNVRPIIDGTGLVLQGSGGIPRALFEFSGSYYVVENLEFKKAYNGAFGGGSYNGAGIRMNGGSNITIRNCKITQCEDGIMSNNASNISIEYCEVADNGDNTNPTPGYAHNFYMSGTSIRVLGCYIHDSTTGHNFKSRMHYIELLYNYICDANSAEVNIVDDTETTSANSNAVLIGNIIRKRDSAPKSGIAGNDVQFIVFGQDVGGTRNGELYI